MFEQPIIKAFTRFLSLAVIVLALVAGIRPAQAQDITGTLEVDDTERSYQLHLPDGTTGDDPLPLLIALHPVASSSGAMAALTGLNMAADEYDFMVAYPNNYEFSWFDGRDLSRLNLTEVDDVAFIAALIDHLVTEYSVDKSRIYLTGFGNGGMLAYQLACQMPERFAGVAIVGPLMWQHHQRGCPEEATAPVNMLIIHGTEDALYLSEGNVLDAEVILSVEQTLDFWAARHGCPAPESRDNIQRYDQCDDDTHLTYYEVVGGGQNWPRSGNYLLNQFAVDATDLITAFITGPDEWPSSQGEVTDADQTPRTYVFYVPPSYDAEEAMPLVIALHGRTDSGSGMAYLTDLNKLAQEEGFITVYPDGISREWNYARGIPGYPERAHDDAVFLSNLIHDLSLDLNIDPARIYVTGFSNGGFMVERLACEMPDQYAAFAVVGATGYLGMTRDCEDTPPVPILFMHGTEDVSVPWEGLSQTSGQRSFFLTMPILRTVEFWLRHNACTPEYEQTPLPQNGDSPETQVEWLNFTGCPAGAEVTFYAVLGGGHNWPGSPDRLPDFIAGEVNMDIHASEVIWEFFSQYRRESDS